MVDIAKSFVAVNVTHAGSNIGAKKFYLSRWEVKNLNLNRCHTVNVIKAYIDMNYTSVISYIHELFTCIPIS